MDKLQRANYLYREQNYKSAALLYKELVNSGHYGSARRLGWMYMLGEGVNVDLEESLKFFSIAADSGDQESLFGLGKLFQTTSKEDLAVKYFLKAFDSGFYPAGYHLALFYLRNGRTFEDEEKGYFYLKASSDCGHLKSMKLLSIYEMKSKGVAAKAKGCARFLRMIFSLLVVVCKDTNDPRLLI